jgi:hypothetical protein
LAVREDIAAVAGDNAQAIAIAVKL